MKDALRTESLPIPTSEEIDVELQAFIESGLGGLIKHPPGGDETLVFFGNAVLKDLEDDSFPELTEVLRSYVRDRPHMIPSYRSQLFWRVIHNQVIQRDRDYPIGYTKDRWRVALRVLLRTPEVREEIEQDLSWLNVMSNEPRRGAGIKLAVAAYRHLLPKQELTIVEPGSSAGLILRGLQSDTALLPKEILARDEVRRQLDGIMGAKLLLQKGYAIDILKLDKKIRHWIEASSHYPKELLDKQLKQERDHIYHTPANNIEHYTGDFVDDASMADLYSRVKDEDVDVGAAITFLYLLENHERRKALDRLAHLGRLTVVQDFAEIDYHDRTRLRFYKDIYEKSWTYNLFARDNTSGTGIFTKLGSWETGRAYRFRPTSHLLRLLNVQRAA